MHFKLGQQIIDKIRGKKKTQHILPSDCEIVQVEGVDIIRYYVYDFQNIANTIGKDKKILFIDIGANEGQSARYAYHFFDDVQVISYEPLMSCQKFLAPIKEKHPSYIYKNLAISDHIGTITIKESNISGLSSCLDFNTAYLPYQIDNASAIVQEHEVECSTIQKEAEEWHLNNYDLRILKLDTQGTELAILKAASALLEGGDRCDNDRGYHCGKISQSALFFRDTTFSG